MIKQCKVCGKQFMGKSTKHYCSPKCRKDAEVSLRRAPKPSKKPVRTAKRKSAATSPEPSEGITRPDYLDEIASSFWDKLAPVLIKRGHLNILSEDAFAEGCDIYSQLRKVNMALKETGFGLLQIDDKWDNREGTETRSFKESALSDLKRKYTAKFLDFCKAFYLTPASNRGNFGLEEDEDEPKELGKERFF
jgi:P27 family predicted phage terminase small subunit